MFGFFGTFLNKERNAPLASESICLYVKSILEENSDTLNSCLHFVNLANSKKAFSLEKNYSNGNYHQIGTVSFGKLYRKLIWKNRYWKKVYKFCKKNLKEDDVLIFYHSLYLNNLFKKIKNNLKCKIILIGAEIYSDVDGNSKNRSLELESYAYANAHVLISETLKQELSINRPYLILSGDYSGYDSEITKFSSKDNMIHLVYSGTFDPVKGGVYSAIQAFEKLNNKYMLHILGFGDEELVKKTIANSPCKDRIVFEGSKRGKEYLDFLTKCDIGLSTQNENKTFNNSSFPSKIITYAKCNLAVVSTPSISVLSSEFAEIVTLSKSSNSEDIAQAILDSKSISKNSKEFLKSIELRFKHDFVELVKTILNANTYLIMNNCFGGSTGNLSKYIQSSALAQGHNCYFAYHIGKRNKTPYLIKYGFVFEHYLSPLLTRFTGNSLGYMFFSTMHLKKIIKRIKPDLVNVHCMNSYSVNIFRLFAFLKQLNFKTIITNHALFYATGSCGYPYSNCDRYLTGCGKCPNKRYSCKSYVIDRTHRNWVKMYKVLSQSNFVMTSVSDYVSSIHLASPITSSLKNKIILNGVDSNTFKYSGNKFNDNKIHIMYVTSDIKNSNKGFSEFIKVLERFKNDDEYVFHVVGDDKNLCDKYNNVMKHGFISNKNELADLYSCCHLFLITSRRETFSLPVAEALCCGTPVAGYKCGGPESFLSSDYSSLFEYGDLDNMSNYIKSKAYLKFNKLEISNRCSIIYSLDNMTNKYLSLFKETINE